MNPLRALSRGVLPVAILAIAVACSGDDSSSDATAPTTTADAATVRSTGGGTLTVDGVTFTFDADLCLVSGPDLVIDGLGTSDAGETAWITVDRSVRSRDDLAAMHSESQLDAMFPDGADTRDLLQVDVEPDRTSRDQGRRPGGTRWRLVAGDATVRVGTAAVTVDGRAITADGVMLDTTTDDDVPFELAVGCD